MAILFRYDHNWSDPFRLDHEFKTTILTSRKNREQRIAERIAPRKTVALEIMGGGETLIEMQESIAAFLQADWIVPEFTRRLELVATGGVDAAEISFGMWPLPAWVGVGATLVFDDGESREAAVVESLDSMTGIVTLSAETAFDWFLGGGYAYPGLIGRFDQSIRASLKTSAAATLTAEFRVDPGDAHEEDTSAPLTFNGRELWMKKPNWMESVSLEFTGFLETLDFDRGVVEHYAPIPWNRRLWKATYLGRDPAAAEDLLAFWHRLRGQQGEFYMPTWQDDLSLATGAAEASSALVVPGTRVSTLFAGSTVYRAIVALFRDGTYEAKVVSGITDDGTNSTLALTSAWSKDVNSTTALRVCWLPVWRSATDTLTMEWVTRTVAQCQLSFAVTEDL